MAQNLDALDLELSQTQKLYNLIEGRVDDGDMPVSSKPSRRDIGGEMMESLDLQTGYKGIMSKREDRLKDLARKYR